MGNPTTYRDHNLAWDRVRLLKQYDNITFDYDANGIRTRKGSTYYEIDGSNILSETTNGSTIRYYYGNDGIIAFRYNGEHYFYEKNLQGDVTAIYTADGALVGIYVPVKEWVFCGVTVYVTVKWIYTKTVLQERTSLWESQRCSCF